jgi:hypothetical protein
MNLDVECLNYSLVQGIHLDLKARARLLDDED